LSTRSTPSVVRDDHEQFIAEYVQAHPLLLA
jgi:hypothetical protein